MENDRESQEIRLTPRELETLALIARGVLTKEVAAKLIVSEHTIDTHLSNIYSELGVDTSQAAVTEGVKKGVLNAGEIIPQDIDTNDLERLSGAELDIFEMHQYGLSDISIADGLNKGLQQIRNSNRDIKRKLRIQSRNQLVVFSLAIHNPEMIPDFDKDSGQFE